MVISERVTMALSVQPGGEAPRTGTRQRSLGRGPAGISEIASGIAGQPPPVMEPCLRYAARGTAWLAAVGGISMRAMTGPGLRQQAVRLLGRDRECAAIDALLQEARAGAAGALVVRGEPGIGKSALLEYARRQAAPMAVLSAAGVQAESDLAFAGLHELLRPVLDHLGELPGIQAQALAGALGLAPSAGADRLLISAAVLGLLAVAAEERPTLCVVDDAQWVDRPSAEALVFTARRLRAERLGIVFAAREGEAARFETAGMAELTLTGLAEQPAATILASRARRAAPGVRDRLLAEAAGNPLALMELAGGLSEEQLAGLVPLPEAMPLTPRLEGVFRQRIGQLPAAAQTALLIAAVDNTGEAPAVLRAAVGLQLPPDALDPAQQAALIRITGTTITFRHPLVRSALYQAATLSQRQRAHAALAGALAGEENTDRRAWHQAMATLTGDEEVAAALEASARPAQLRAGHASAVTAFLRAAELSTDDARRIQRLAAAAQAAWDAGQADRAREIIRGVLPQATGRTRVELLHLSGRIEFLSGNLRQAFILLVEAADACADPSLTIEILMQTEEAAISVGNMGALAGLSQRARGISPANEPDRFKIAALSGFARFYSGDYREGQALLIDALDTVVTITDPYVLLWASHAATLAKGLGAGLPHINRALDVARQNGLLSFLPRALSRQARELLWSSQFDLAYAVAQEGYRLSIDLGYYSAAWQLMNLAAVEAVWGREQDARSHADEALALGSWHGFWFQALSEWTLGMIEMTAGRLDQAADRLLALTAPGRPDIDPTFALEAMPEAIEAGVRAGRPAEAAQRLEVLRRLATAAPTRGRQALLAQCEALLGVRDSDEAFQQAVAAAPELPPLQRARTQLLYGEWLRRERRRTDARVHLRAALEGFRTLGAVPWAERAEAELRATGETVRKRDASAVKQLTPQELQIAGLVTSGLTNKEIAAQLFLSPRTVDYHLRKVFTKLGIASRTELAPPGTAPAHDRLSSKTGDLADANTARPAGSSRHATRHSQRPRRRDAANANPARRRSRDIPRSAARSAAHRRHRRRRRANRRSGDHGRDRLPPRRGHHRRDTRQPRRVPHRPSAAGAAGRPCCRAHLQRQPAPVRRPARPPPVHRQGRPVRPRDRKRRPHRVMTGHGAGQSLWAGPRFRLVLDSVSGQLADPLDEVRRVEVNRVAAVPVQGRVDAVGVPGIRPLLYRRYRIAALRSTIMAGALP
jgi:DNA-binding CsgD family transcriptional regulator